MLFTMNLTINMKRYFFLLVILFSLAGAAFAQVYYCTGDKVRVRNAPSLKSGMVHYYSYYGSGGPVYLYKGMRVRSEGVHRNGFTKVSCIDGNAWCTTGWVASEYLRGNQYSAPRAKDYFHCTGDKVRVRNAPSLNSGMVQYYNGAGAVYLYKGMRVRNLGVRRNGFIKVSCYDGSTWCTDGWVSADYLR